MRYGIISAIAQKRMFKRAADARSVECSIMKESTYTNSALLDACLFN